MNYHGSKNKIKKVDSVKVMNLLRGVMSKNDPDKIKKAFKRIKTVGSNNDYKQSLEFIRVSDLFKTNTVSRDFNSACPVGLPDLVIFNKQEIIRKINSQGGRLSKLIDLYRKAVIFSQRLKYEECLDICQEIINEEGVSCHLLRLLYYINLHCNENKITLKRIEDTLVQINFENVIYLVNAIRELSSSKTDFFNTCTKINNANSKKPLSHIVKSYVSHIPSNEEEYLSTLNSFYSFSLLDALLYIGMTSSLKLPFANDLTKITTIVKDAYSSLANVKINISFYLLPDHNGTDIDFYRECFLLIENNECFKYKTVHGALYNTNENKEGKRTPYERTLINHYFSSVKGLRDLRNTRHGGFGIGIDKYRASCCNFLENSNAMIHFIENSDANIPINQEKYFMELMSYTIDIGLICPMHYLHKINESSEDLNLRLVLTCLISIKDKSQIVEHALRKIIQEVTKLNFNSDIKGLIKYIYDISPSVALFLMQMCDETFLSRLFHITEKPNKAIEERAALLEWYGEKTNNSTYIERAKNLRIDVQINKSKGTIDDSRVYVDNLRFTQWMSDNKLNDLTLLFDIDSHKQDLIGLDWNNIKTGLSYNEQIGGILQDCYSEFCNNKIFGIASYIGRRIRHGTFKGTGLKEVKDFYTNVKYSHLLANDVFRDCYDAWVDSYDHMLEDLKISHLHINCKKKPKGMIMSRFDSSFKQNMAARLYSDMKESYEEHRNNAKFTLLITEYCWRIVTEDLNNIQKTLMENKSKHAVFSVQNTITNTSRKDINEFCKELNSVTAEKFRVISSWFKKPSIVSPSTDIVILFKTVVSEVKGFIQDFQPEIVLDDNVFEINGGLYYVIYDALYILIFNAAKHGKKGGSLELKIELLHDLNVIKISITSEFNDIDNSKNLIKAAFDSDFEDAHIIEGDSGIKKLRRMEKDKYIENPEYHFQGNLVTASFNYKIDL